MSETITKQKIDLQTNSNNIEIKKPLLPELPSVSQIRSKWKKWTFLGSLGIGLTTSIALRARFNDFATAYDNTGGNPLDLPEHKSIEFKTSSGAVLAVSIFEGKGSPIVLSHGWTENQKLWSCLVKELQKDKRYVITYDHQGHGDSSIGNLGLTVDAISQDLSDLIEGLDLNDVILVGHSMGGMTAQNLMINKSAKNRVKALILVATAASAVPLASLAKIQPLSDQIVSLLRSSLLEEAFLNDSVGMLLVSGAHGKKPPKAQLLATRDMFLQTQKEARSDFVVDMSKLDLVDDLVEIKVPTIIMVGTKDTLTPLFLAKQIHSKIKDSVLVKLQDRGHMLPFESFMDIKESIDKLTKLTSKQ
jgi:pimeloyl-ACP methyl ester carboxylesterase